VELDLHAVLGFRRNRPALRKQAQRGIALSLLVEHLQRLAPGCLLAVVDLRRARPYGNCWLGCERWRQLELDRFWEQKRERGREAGSWAQVLELLVVNRRIEHSDMAKALDPFRLCPSRVDGWMNQRQLPVIE